MTYGSIHATGFYQNIKTVATSYTADAKDAFIIVTATATITLPSPGSVGSGKIYTLKHYNTSNFNMSIVSTSGKIDNNAPSVPFVSNSSIKAISFISDGTNWLSASSL